MGQNGHFYGHVKQHRRFGNVTQCAKFDVFSATQILREIDFAEF